MEDKILDNEDVKELSLLFENVENVTLDAKTDIDSIRINEIVETGHLYDYDKIESRQVIHDCEISINKTGADRLINTPGYGPIRVFERLRYNDICEIEIKRENGQIESLYPYWKGLDTTNKCQFSFDIYDGSIILYIVKNKKKRKKLKKRMKRMSQ